MHPRLRSALQWARPLLPDLAALLLALLALGLQIHWLNLDKGPPESDEWHHLTKSYAYHQAWVSGGLQGLMDKLGTIKVGFPPLVHLAAIPFYQGMGGFSMRAAALSLGPWLVLLILSTYGIGKRAAGPSTGLVAAAVVAALPMTISLSHKYLLDLTLGSLIAASLWALLGARAGQGTEPERAHSYKNTLFALLAGLFFGLALLAKFTAGVFLLGAFLFLILEAAWGVLRSRSRVGIVALLALALPSAWIGWWVLSSLKNFVACLERGQKVALFGISEQGDPETLQRNLLVLLAMTLLPLILGRLLKGAALRASLDALSALFLAALVASIWYLPHGVDTVSTVLSFTVDGGSGEGDPTVRTLRGWIYYPWALGRLCPRSWFQLFLVGIFVTPFLRRLRGPLAPVLVGLAFSFLVLNLSPNKEARYLVPLSATAAVVAVVWTSALPRLPRVLVQATVGLVALGILTSWYAVREGIWRAPMSACWLDDHIGSTGTVLPTGHLFPPSVGLMNILQTPDAYVVMQLPRDMPFTEKELPLGNTGP